MLSSTDVKRQPRFELAEAFSVEVVIEPDDHRVAPSSIAATVLNLSGSGAKLAVPMVLERDKTFRIRLAVDQLGLHFYLSARVCWAAPDNAAACVIGCQLTPHIPEAILQHVAAGGRLNRRDRNRLATAHKVSVIRPGFRLFAKASGTLRNYAPGGVCLETKAAAQLGEVLRIRLDKSANCEVAVVVRWVVQQGERFLIGCEYEAPQSFDELRTALSQAGV